MLYLAAPWWLSALLLPLLLGVYCYRQAHRQQGDSGTALIHPLANLLGELAQTTPSRLRFPWLWLSGLILLSLALSRPQWLETHGEDTRLGRDIMLALDVSGSTRAQDFIIDGNVADRLDVIKATARQLIEQRRGDRIGVVVFGDDAYTLIPLTADFVTVLKLINDLENNIAGEKTALGDAMVLASKRLKEASASQQDRRQRVLVLVTDGANTAGDTTPQNALNIAKAQGIRIHTVGVGSHRRVAFPRAVLQQPELVEMPFDEALLQRIAAETGGRYFVGGDSETLLHISQEIDQLEQTEHGIPLGATQELYWLPLGAGLFLLLFAAHRLLTPDNATRLRGARRREVEP